MPVLLIEPTYVGEGQDPPLQWLCDILTFRLSALISTNNKMLKHKAVILSERSESKDLGTNFT